MEWNGKDKRFARAELKPGLCLLLCLSADLPNWVAPSIGLQETRRRVLRVPGATKSPPTNGPLEEVEGG